MTGQLTARLTGRALGVALGLLLDRALGEPPDAAHPVAWFGTAMQAVERSIYADNRPRGLLHAATGVTVGLSAGAALTALGRRIVPSAALSETLATTVAVALASSGRMLRHTSLEVEQLLVANDLAAARERLTWLAGRDPSSLDESGIAAAVVESLAENTVDAVVAPAFWALVAGAPGALAHRAVNTMDAMVGHHSQRYEHYGWAAARVDDAMAWVPARIMAALVALLAPVTPGAPGPGRVLAVVGRDAPAHPSPNAGVAESAVAAALTVQLGGPLRYGERVEERPFLGEGPRPTSSTIARARRLVGAVEWALVGTAAGLWTVRRGRRLALLRTRRRAARQSARG